MLADLAGMRLSSACSNLRNGCESVSSSIRSGEQVSRRQSTSNMVIAASLKPFTAWDAWLQKVLRSDRPFEMTLYSTCRGECSCSRHSAPA